MCNLKYCANFVSKQFRHKMNLHAKSYRYILHSPASMEHLQTPCRRVDVLPALHKIVRGCKQEKDSDANWGKDVRQNVDNMSSTLRFLVHKPILVWNTLIALMGYRFAVDSRELGRHVRLGMILRSKKGIGNGTAESSKETVRGLDKTLARPHATTNIKNRCLIFNQ